MAQALSVYVIRFVRSLLPNRELLSNRCGRLHTGFSFLRRVCVLLLAAALLPWLPARPAQAATPATLFPRYRVTTTASGHQMLVRVVTELWDETRPYTFSELAALGPNLDLRADALRGTTLLLAIPPGAEIAINNIRGENRTLVWSQEHANSSNQPPPAVAELIGQPFWLREQRVQRLHINPLQWDRANRVINVRLALEVELTLQGAWQEAPSPRPDPFWEPLYQQVLSNYQEGRHWRQSPPTKAEALGPAPPAGAGETRVRITVSEPGLQQITYADLAALPFALETLDPRRLQLYRGRDKIAVQVLGEEDGRLDPGDAILFYAPPWRAEETSAQVYWLTAVESLGMRAGRRQANADGPLLPAYRDVLHLEEEHVYFSDMPMRENADHWYWATVRPDRSGEATKTIVFDIKPVAWGPIDANLRLHVFGRGEGDASVRLWLNGYAVGSFSLKDRQEATPSFLFPHFLLRDKANEVTLKVLQEGEHTNIVVLDWVEIEYVRRFEAVDNHLQFDVDWPGVWRVELQGFDAVPWVWDISQPLLPVVVEDVHAAVQSDGAMTATFVSQAPALPRYVAATAAGMSPLQLALAPAGEDLRSPQQQADYLIITPAVLKPAAERLADHRRSQGLRSKVVMLQDIYDAFNAGGAAPAAIRDFLGYTLSQWQAPAPAFVLLLGDGHYDPQQRLADLPVRVPIYPRIVDPWLGEVADENYFVAVGGADIVPDMMMGRLPVQTLAEANKLVDKLIAYDAMSSAQSWQHQMLLVADDPDTAGDFYALADAVAAQVDNHLRVSKFYLYQTQATPDQLRSELLAAWSQGALLVNYIGHGRPDAWAGERFFLREHVPALQNYARPAILLSMASLTGIFYWPTSPSLQEELLLLPEGRGVVAYIASTGFGLAAGNALINEGFLEAMLSGRNERLGADVLLAKLHLFAQGYSYTDFLVRQYTLLGDPATVIPVPPWPEQSYLPLQVVGN